MRRIVVDAELVADAVLLADPVQRDPGARRVGDVVVPVVARRPAGHRALLDAVGQAARLGLLEQRHEPLLEVDQVLVHRALLVAADEAADRVDAEQRRRVEDPQHEVVLLLPDGRVVVQQVVEVADIRDADAVRLQGRLDAARAVLVERFPQIQRVGDRIQHRLGRHVGFGRMKRRRQLDVVGAEGAGELDPLLDGAIGIGVADLAGGQFLQGGREDADFHELGLEGFNHSRIIDEEMPACQPKTLCYPPRHSHT